MQHFQDALAFDIHVRRDLDEKFPADGVRVEATDITEGVVYESGGVTVRAFLVDHGPVQPAYGYRVDYRGRSVALSGDTEPSDNLIKATTGVDVLVHEMGRLKSDPAFAGPPDELLPNSHQTRRQLITIAAHHTDPVEVGVVLSRVRPRLGVFSHYNADPARALPLVRRNYDGAVEFGEDGMTIDIGATVAVRRRDAAK
jgi:ribonuclease Z